MAAMCRIETSAKETCPHGSGPRLACAPDEPLVGRKPFQRDRTTGVQAPSRYSDFGAEPEFAAIGKLG